MAQIGRCDKCKKIVNSRLDMSSVDVLDIHRVHKHNSFKESIELCIPCTIQLANWLKEQPPMPAEEYLHGR